jgi:uncharacterized membrane protein HdeD (DUF308 family)
MKPMERIFVARGVLALVFAVLVFLAIGLIPDYAARIFAGFSILDGLLALAAAYRAHPSWTNPRKSALFAEGFIACVAGVVIAFHDHDASVIAFAIAANAIIGGALASVYSMSEKTEYRADWWAVYGILGVVLGFAVAPLMALGIPAMLLAVGVVTAVQGIARLMLRGGSGRKTIRVNA